MDLSRSSKVSSKELSGPEKVALTVKKVKHAQARKIVNESVDRTFGSLRKKRKLSSLQQSFVMKQASSLRRQNREIVNELVKLRKYTTMVENMNHSLKEQEGKLLAKNIHLIEKIKRLSAENTSLQRLLHKLQQKYDFEDEEIAACLHRTVEPGRITLKLNDSNADLLENSSDSTSSLFESKLPSPMTLLNNDVCPEETLPSYVYLSICEAEVESQKSDQNNTSSNPAEFGILSPLSLTSQPVRGSNSLPQMMDNLPKCMDTLAVPTLKNQKESQEEDSDVNDDFNNLNLRLPESAESSFISNGSTELECNPKELPPTTSDENLPSRQIENSNPNLKPDSIEDNVSTSKTNSSIVSNSSVQNVFDCEPHCYEDTPAIFVNPLPTSDSSKDVSKSRVDEHVRIESSSVASPELKASSIVIEKLCGDKSLSGRPENAVFSATNDSTELSTCERQFSNTPRRKSRRKIKPTLQDWLKTAPNSKSSQNIADNSEGLHSTSEKIPCTKDLRLKDINMSKTKSSSTIDKEGKPGVKVADHDQLTSGPLSESSQNATVHSPTATTIDAAKDVGNSQKASLKSRNANVTKKRGRAPKKRKPSNKAQSCYDFLSTSKDSFIMDDNKQVELPQVQSLPADADSDENVAPVRRASRARPAVSYAEPKISSKLRRGDKHTDGSLYVSFSPKKLTHKNAC